MESHQPTYKHNDVSKHGWMVYGCKVGLLVGSPCKKRGVLFVANAYLPGVFDSLPGAEITQNPNNEKTRNQAPV